MPPPATASKPAAAALPPPPQDDDYDYEEVEEEYEEIEEIVEEEEEEIEGDENQPHHNDDEDYPDGNPSDGEYEEGEETGEEEDDTDPDQENILNTVTFPISSLKGHHIMVLHASAKMIYVGTNQGVVAVLDVNGRESKRFQNHSDPISDICCDEKEMYAASTDKAGGVCVQCIDEVDDFYERRFDHPLEAVALHPHYGSTDKRPIVCGGSDKVILITKTIFIGSRTTSTIKERAGKVRAIRWCGDLIAWASDRGVTLYSYSMKTEVGFFARPADSPKPDLYRCCLFWEDSRTLIVGWADWVSVIGVKENSLEERVLTKEFTKLVKADVQTSFRTSIGRNPYRICGLAPFDKHQLLILSCLIDSKREGVIEELEVRVVHRLTTHDKYRATLASKHKHPLHFSLSYSPSSRFLDATYFIVSLDTVIKSTPCDQDDHVQHLLKYQRFQDAYTYAVANASALKRHRPGVIGQYLLDSLICNQEFDVAAQQLRSILGTDPSSKEKWEKWVDLFLQKKEAVELIDYLPRYVTSHGQRVLDGPHIRSQLYELVLSQCLDEDIELFKKAVRMFDGLFNHLPVSLKVESEYARLTKEKVQGRKVDLDKLRLLGETYAVLLELQDKNEEALSVLMDVRGTDELFAFIENKSLFAKACTLLPELFAKSVSKTLALLLRHAKSDSSEMDPLTAEAVVKRLEGSHRNILWAFIKELRGRDEPRFQQVYQQLCHKHAQLIAMLHIEFDRPGLLRFLKENYNYLIRMKDIHQQCKQNGLLEEMVFLMARMGKQDEGLRIIVEDMKNVSKAIDFIRDFPTDEDQLELFKKLVDYVAEMDAKLPGQAGDKHFDHLVLDEETWSSIALKYGVREIDLRSFNHAAGAASSTLPRPHVKVPMNMLAALLSAVSDPTVSEKTAIDPILLIKVLPPTRIPNVGESLSRIAKSKAAHKALMETLLRVLSGDVGELQRKLHRSRSRGVRLDPSYRVCFYCNEHCVGTNIVIFPCKHTYHPKCVVDYMQELGELKPEWGPFPDADRVVRHPDLFFKVKPHYAVPYCKHCPPLEDN